MLEPVSGIDRSDSCLWRCKHNPSRQLPKAREENAGVLAYQTRPEADRAGIDAASSIPRSFTLIAGDHYHGGGRKNCDHMPTTSAVSGHVLGMHYVEGSGLVKLL